MLEASTVAAACWTAKPRATRIEVVVDRILDREDYIFATVKRMMVGQRVRSIKIDGAKKRVALL